MRLSDFGFPFPCSFDLGLLRLDIGRNCVVLKRADRDYPHVTLFYEKNRKLGCWWLHITEHPRKRREELAQLKEHHGPQAESRLNGFLLPQVAPLLRPICIEELQAEGWDAIVPDLDFVKSFVGSIVLGRTIDLTRVEEPQNVDRFFDDLARCAIALDDIPQCSAGAVIWLVQVTETGEIESGNLIRSPLEASGSDWFFCPMGVLKPDPASMLRALTPQVFEVLSRISVALDVPLNLAADSEDDEVAA